MDFKGGCRSALHDQEIELEKYKKYKNCQLEKEKVEQVDEHEYEKAELSVEYDLLLRECVSTYIMNAIIRSFESLDEKTELQCLYLEKIEECEGLVIELPKQTEHIIQIILFIVDSGCTKHMTGNLKLLCNFVEKYLGTVRFGNDQFALILIYGDLVQGNITIKRVYYVKCLNHNIFSVGQFCYADLEVAFQKSTCFVRDLQGNNLLMGTRGSDLHTISLQETSSPTPTCFKAKVSPTQAWPRALTTKDYHNQSELEIQDHNNEPSSSKLVPTVVPPPDTS
ncbi:hypothetical protein Tco_0652979 [Tanacetum coccineum]|uniref:Retrovirus-related Pol polyprotein from transposon TNT 1-94-like beta-barrel domain-containing protein n=1 Tax=Tanacetum coccineum TaxID=301880 RepID=A0ABQ4WZW2_9ASTR